MIDLPSQRNSKISFCGLVVAPVKSAFGEVDVGFHVTEGKRDIVILGRNALRCMGISTVPLNNVNNVKKPMTRSCEVNSLEERHNLKTTVTETERNDLEMRGSETSGVNVMCSQRTRSTKMEEKTPPTRDVPSTATSPQADTCNHNKQTGHYPKPKKKMKCRGYDDTFEPIHPFPK